LPNPYGGNSQPAFPWRGRITCDPAHPGEGSVEKTATARAQGRVLRGAAAKTFPNSGTLAYVGDSGDWGYRRLILHYAHLAAAAGGDRQLSDRIRNACIDDAARRGKRVSFRGSAVANWPPRCGRFARVWRRPSPTAPTGRNISDHQPTDGQRRRVLPPRSALVARRNHRRWHRQLHAALRLARRGLSTAATRRISAALTIVDGLRRQIPSGEGYDWYYANNAARADQTRGR
jgi:hypothetical protein